MSFYIIEIKARCKDLDRAHARLMQAGADYRGEDHQIDTYFGVESGRLKLRQGKIENTLIRYHRPNIEGPKRSEVELFHPESADATDQLGKLLRSVLPIKVVVDKKRRIYFIGHIKFHLDRVNDLGTFAEIEAIDKDGSIGEAQLQREVDHYMELLGIEQNELVACSYSDLLLEQAVI